jgi:hypothetical protein
VGYPRGDAGVILANAFAWRPATARASGMTNDRADITINIEYLPGEPLRARVELDAMTQQMDFECREAFLERVAAAAKPMLLNFLRQSVKTQEASFHAYRDA